MSKNKSFTLIELLVVIVIIGILAGVIVISTSSAIDKANFAKAQAFSNTVQNELLFNLISEWTFDEPQTGNVTKDSWGSNHGTVVGATQVDDCVYGKCYSFNGTTNYIDCGNGNALEIKNEITISVWIKSNQLVSDFWRQIAGKGTSSPYGIFLEWSAIGGYYRFEIGSGSVRYLVDGPVNVVGIWMFVVGTYNENNGILKMYKDGKLFKEKNIGNGKKIDTGTNNFTIGGSSRFFNGSIDDVRIYDLALSNAQIKQNYIAGLNSMLSNGNISKQEYNERLNELAFEK